VRLRAVRVPGTRQIPSRSHLSWRALPSERPRTRQGPLLQPIPLDLPLNQVVIANAGVTALLVLWVTVLGRHTIGRVFGGALVAAYVGYRVVSLLG